MSGRGHVPMRTCLGCGQRAPQSELIRVARDGHHHLVIDRRRCAVGRGAYLHDVPSCWERFAGRKGQVRSLGIAVDRPMRVALVEQLRQAAGC